MLVLRRLPFIQVRRQLPFGGEVPDTMGLFDHVPLWDVATLLLEERRSHLVTWFSHLVTELIVYLRNSDALAAAAFRSRSQLSNVLGVIATALLVDLMLVTRRFMSTSRSWVLRAWKTRKTRTTGCSASALAGRLGRPGRRGGCSCLSTRSLGSRMHSCLAS